MVLVMPRPRVTEIEAGKNTCLCWVLDDASLYAIEYNFLLDVRCHRWELKTTLPRAIATIIASYINFPVVFHCFLL